MSDTNSKKTLYLECQAGISGDMTVGALLDLGADWDVLVRAIDSLQLAGVAIAKKRVSKAGISTVSFEVQLDHAHENHDHDMAYLHGEGHASSHDHHHHHHHDDDHSHSHHHHHEHRGLLEIRAIIRGADMTDAAKALATRIFEILAKAESKAHGVPADEVHFHEVGAVDSIVDILAVAVCVDNLGIEDVIVEELCEGRGTVRCQHGVLPIPVPATANICADEAIPLHIMPVEGEFVTPTGAAIAAALRTKSALPKSFAIRQIGIGAGKREYERASLLRAMVIEETGSGNECEGSSSEKTAKAKVNTGEIYKLECDIDDATGEMLGHAMEVLLEAGAREVHFQPITMKKNRPGHELIVLAEKEDVKRLEDLLFLETTTIGVRRQKMERTMLSREIVTVETQYGPVKAKKVILPNGNARYYPEYEEIKKLQKTLANKGKVCYYSIWKDVQKDLPPEN